MVGTVVQICVCMGGSVHVRMSCRHMGFVHLIPVCITYELRGWLVYFWGTCV